MATKIKDGLFIGDAEASQDPEFIELNKITFVINCAGREMPNLWEQHGLHYLTFPWTSDPDCTLFDGGNVVIEQVTLPAFELPGDPLFLLFNSRRPQSCSDTCEFGGVSHGRSPWKSRSRRPYDA